jgi:hypothetical protein
MTDSIHIGDAGYKPRPTRPLTSLPNRLDANGITQVLERLDPELAKLAASNQKIDVADLDAALQYVELSVADRLRLKDALFCHRLMSPGKKVR